VRKPRVLIAKVGLDGHDRGARLVANTLREAGMEVLYTGLRRTVDEVAGRVLADRPDYLGLSFLAGDHLVLVPKIIAALKARRAPAIRILVGGIIAEEHVPPLLAMGVDRVFLPGTPLAAIEGFIREQTASQHPEGVK
jgi:methylmalonyl-CoA mutase C-terminal domain/subunit